MQTVRRVLAIVSLVVMAVFAIQNLTYVDVVFLNWSVSVPKVAVIVLAYLLGMITGWGFFGFVKRSMQSKRPTE